MKVLTKVLCAGMLIGLVAGCASNGTYVPSLPAYAKAVYMDYQAQPDNKVFVIAMDPNGDFAIGYDYGKATKKEAYNVALEECKANCEVAGVLSDPYVYAINDTVVYKESRNKGPAK